MQRISVGKYFFKIIKKDNRKSPWDVLQVSLLLGSVIIYQWEAGFSGSVLIARFLFSVLENNISLIIL